MNTVTQPRIQHSEGDMDIGRQCMCIALWKWRTDTVTQNMDTAFRRWWGYSDTVYGYRILKMMWIYSQSTWIQH